MPTSIPLMYNTTCNSTCRSDYFVYKSDGQFFILAKINISLSIITILLYALVIIGLIRSYQSTTRMFLLINLCITGTLNSLSNITYDIYMLTFNKIVLDVAVVFLRFRLMRLFIMNILTMDAFLKVYLATHQVTHKIHKYFRNAIYTSYTIVIIYQIVSRILDKKNKFKDAHLFSYAYLVLAALLCINVFLTYFYILWLLVRSKLRLANQVPKALNNETGSHCSQVIQTRTKMFTVDMGHRMASPTNVYIMDTGAQMQQNIGKREEQSTSKESSALGQERSNHISTFSHSSSKIKKADQTCRKPYGPQERSVARSTTVDSQQLNHKMSLPQTQANLTTKSTCCRTVFSLVFVILLVYVLSNMAPQIFIITRIFHGHINPSMLVLQGLFSMAGNLVESTIYIMNSTEVQTRLRRWKRVRRAKQQFTGRTGTRRPPQTTSMGSTKKAELYR